jgi:hypothetical protein
MCDAMLSDFVMSVVRKALARLSSKITYARRASAKVYCMASYHIASLHSVCISVLQTLLQALRTVATSTVVESVCI